jgi:hypothetical protein
MRRTTLLFAALALASPLSAQRADNYGLELRPLIGAYVPAGDQRDAFKDATMLGVQAAFEYNSLFHLVATTTWTHGHARVAGLSTDVTYIWQYDVGGEFGVFQDIGESWSFRPFAGAGAGARTYDYRASLVDSEMCTAGYGSLGMELQRDLLGLRMEGRGYAHCFKAPVDGARRVTRYDGALMFGVSYHFR